MNNPVYGPENRPSVEATVRLAYWDYIERLPRALFRDEWGRVNIEAGGANKWLFPPIATGETSPGTRMCPDVLHSILSYDVTESPLKLLIPVSRDPFWSLTLISDNAEAFFGVDDQVVEGDSLELVILGHGQLLPCRESVRVVASPSDQGVVVVRTVVPDQENLAALDRLRKRAKSVPAT